MLDSDYFGQLTAGLIYLFVGMRLLGLSGRTGEKPERYLGLYFLLTGIDYASYASVYCFRLESLFAPFDFMARVAYAIAVVYLLKFVCKVFRPGETWATWASTICSLALIVAIVGSALNGDWSGVEVDGLWYRTYFVGYSVALLWMTAEALRAYSGARKRHRIGLCDRTVVNRYMLWSCFGAFQVFASAGIFFMNMDHVGASATSGIADMLLSGTEVASIAALWLAFFPPAAYLSWISGAQDNANSPAGG